ncbi:hypothetical protein ACFL6C_14210 [Myxococcota bacterium]
MKVHDTITTSDLEIAQKRLDMFSASSDESLMVSSLYKPLSIEIRNKQGSKEQTVVFTGTGRTRELPAVEVVRPGRADYLFGVTLKDLARALIDLLNDGKPEPMAFFDNSQTCQDVAVVKIIDSSSI